MCKCIPQVEDNITKHIVETKKETLFSGRLKNVGISFSKNSHVRTYNEFEYEGQREKKDGTPSKRFTRRVSIYHTYCPFCGEKYPSAD